ncbi:MAG TPA: HAMP domain-containing sensor histidine kinase [Cyclobacteriaceae bacterium]|nr:HAMP domain-containing sensor histidine kinase [Cyclobacteriaceae bacterium]
MKLLNRTNRYFLAVSMMVFCLGGILFYFLFQVVIDTDLTNKLRERRNYVLKQITKSDSLILYQNLSANTLSIKPTAGVTARSESFSDTVIYDEIEHRAIRYRQLRFIAQNEGRRYDVQIRRALIEQTDLIKGVVLLESALFAAFVTILTILNNLLSRRIWKPFYRILDTVNNYKLDRAESLTFDRGTISEFNELATSIEKMSTKITHEFTIQKQFIENASHETQTPLAIIKNEMEVLLQSPGLSEKQIQSIGSASLAANRLSKVNESLLILSRIENRQFHVVEDICVNDLVDHHLENFDELMQMKGITVQKHFPDRLGTKMNPFLADMLLENLITNAIKHNTGKGMISISIEGRGLIIANSGDDPRQETGKLFERFAKSNPRSPSLGLGLSIVRAICETYMLPIKYTYQNNLHKVYLEFRDPDAN